MPRPIHFFLILLIAVTSIGLGTARGTIMRGQEVMLCSGDGVVVTRLPASPEIPLGGVEAHLCPDMALSMMLALAEAGSSLPPQRLSVLYIPAIDDAIVDGVPARDIRVRDPPSGTRSYSGKIS
ncbi:MAG: hypothetical protein P3W94_002150 [Paracoccus sp. (in: a-proteobacteria)]|nr:hypothetical protein [Paracoccus sp. (in: a-proteobacteria)]